MSPFKMRWGDLHEFHVATEDGASSVVIGIPIDDEFESGHQVHAGWEHAVVDYVSEPETVMRYDYDFGDGWTHSIRLEGVEAREIGQKYPRCTAGERACPPEDCGGIGGYDELVHALLDPAHPEYAQMGDWIPRGWMPEAFKPAAVRFDNPRARWKRAFGGG